MRRDGPLSCSVECVLCVRWVVTGQAPSTQPQPGINHDDDDLVATSNPYHPTRHNGCYVTHVDV